MYDQLFHHAFIFLYTDISLTYVHKCDDKYFIFLKMFWYDQFLTQFVPQIVWLLIALNREYPRFLWLIFSLIDFFCISTSNEKQIFHHWHFHISQFFSNEVNKKWFAIFFIKITFLVKYPSLLVNITLSSQRCDHKKAVVNFYVKLEFNSSQVKLHNNQKHRNKKSGNKCN